MDSSPVRKIILHRGLDFPGRYIWSPFVTKLEFRFRHSGLAYTCGSCGPREGPKGKMPFVELSAPGNPVEVLPDSALIIKSLVTRGLLKNLNSALSGKEVAQDLAMKALLEDKLTFYNMHERWIENYYAMRDFNLSPIPYPIRVIVGYLVYRNTVRKLHDQGTSRFSDDEIHAFRREIWEGVNAVLGDSRRQVDASRCFWVMGGKEPTECDFTVFGYVVSTMVADAGPKSRDMVKKEFPAVIDYATRIHQQYFPDYQRWD